MAIDPVCEMQVDEETAEHKSDYEEKNYVFCSADCKSEFDENPEAYINR